MSSQTYENQNNPSRNRTLDSEEDSEDGYRHEDQLVSNELSIMERLGPNSFNMTEEELETAFSQLALAFRCDQYTLDQRVQAEEHARNRAEESLKLEVDLGQDLLEGLKGMCLDIKRANMVQRLELCLSIIRGTAERIARAAEVLGAVHQEAKVSRAVELMVAHVENLRRRNEKDTAELEEMKKQMQKSSRARPTTEPREEVEAMQKTEKEKDAHQPTLRRRISAAVILKPEQRKQSVPLSEEVSGTSSQVQSINLRGPNQSVKSDQENNHQPPVRRAVPTLVRHRLKSPLDNSSHWAKSSEHVLKTCSSFATGLQRPLMHWMCHCRWLILILYLMVLCSIITLAILVWFLQAPVLWL